MELRKIDLEFVDWIHLFQDKDQWQAVVNTVMILRGPIKAEGLYYMDSVGWLVGWLVSQSVSQSVIGVARVYHCAFCSSN
jgi:hypothetical protein